MNKDDEKPMNSNSSAANVEKHLQELEKTDYEQLYYYSQEQTFSADELARVINEKRLHELLARSDDFLSSVNSEIKDFDE